MRAFSWFVIAVSLRLGPYVPGALVRRIRLAIDHFEISRWLKSHDLAITTPLFPRAPASEDSDRYRRDLYAQIAAPISEQHVLYLEFGVHEGRSIAQWGELLANPQSELHGFDSFEGLPERYRDLPAGEFDVGGAAPQLSDARIAFHKGWFAETLPGFELPPHDVLVVNIDADLYSSTKFVLDTIGDAITPGTILIFDEFFIREHEFTAFAEFVDERGYAFSVLGTTYPRAAQVAFIREHHA